MVKRIDTPIGRMVIMHCGTCGTPFGMQEEVYDHCYREGGFWTCPNGHRRGWEKGNEERLEVELRRERDRLKQRQAQLEDEVQWQRKAREAAERSASAHKGQVTRLKNRAKAGVCPCCNRTFQNLAAHMKTKHPDFSADADNVVEIAARKAKSGKTG